MIYIYWFSGPNTWKDGAANDYRRIGNRLSYAKQVTHGLVYQNVNSKTKLY